MFPSPRRPIYSLLFTSFLACSVQAEIFCDFEEPVYHAGESFHHVDSWELYGGGEKAGSTITPDPLGTGYISVLSGEQSAFFNHDAWKPFAPKFPIQDIQELSFLISLPTTITDETVIGVYFADKFSYTKVAGISLRFAEGMNEIFLQGIEEVPTGISIRVGPEESAVSEAIYRMVLKLDWTEMTMEGLLEDITSGEDPVNLGKVDFEFDTSMDGDDYGLFIRSAGQYIYLDDVEIVKN